MSVCILHHVTSRAAKENIQKCKVLPKSGAVFDGIAGG